MDKNQRQVKTSSLASSNQPAAARPAGGAISFFYLCSEKLEVAEYSYSSFKHHNLKVIS